MFCGNGLRKFAKLDGHKMYRTTVALGEFLFAPVGFLRSRVSEGVRGVAGHQDFHVVSRARMQVAMLRSGGGTVGSANKDVDDTSAEAATNQLPEGASDRVESGRTHRQLVRILKPSCDA